MLYQFHWGYEKQGRRLDGVPATGRTRSCGRCWPTSWPRPRQEADLHAPGGLRLLQGRGRGQRHRPVRRGRQPRARPLRAAAPGQGGRPVHRRLPARRRRGRARRAGPAGGHRRPARLRGRPRVVRAEPLPGLCPPARAGRRAGRGAGRVCPRPHPRRARLRPRGRARDARSCSSRAIAARATASATRPARTSPTRRRCWSCWAPIAIGIELGDEDQLWPEQSTSAIVLHHPAGALLQRLTPRVLRRHVGCMTRLGYEGPGAGLCRRLRRRGDFSLGSIGCCH